MKTCKLTVSGTVTYDEDSSDLEIAKLLTGDKEESYEGEQLEIAYQELQEEALNVVVSLEEQAAAK